MNSIKKIKARKSHFEKYKELVPKDYKKCLKLAKKLKGRKIIHLNSTQLGGGVSELLRSQIPIEKSLGIDSSWYIINAPIKFFQTTKKIHNLLQGEPGFLPKQEKTFYLNWLDKELCPHFKKIIQREKPDILVIHDPQPLPLINCVPENIPTALRLHIDLSNPNPHILSFLEPLIKKYRKIILSHKKYQPSWLASGKTEIIMPAINAFTAKNRTIKKSKADSILNLYHINTDFPIVSQVSRFDPWKDPLGTLRAYYLAKNKIPKLQLILAGLFQAKDDPQAKTVFKKIKKQAAGDPDIFLFANPKKLKEINNNLFINAVYTASDVIMQKSIKEGFGLTVTEAMWKAKPVIGGNTGGIALQIKHNKNGFLVSSEKQAAKYLVKLLKDEKLRKKIGEKARQSVKNKFLMPRFISEHLKLYLSLLT